MKLKQSVKVIISVILIAAAFSVSYKLTLSSERKKLAENALRFAQPVAGDLLISEAAATEPPTEPADEQSPTAAEAADRLPDPIIVNMPSDDTWSLVMLNKYYKMNDTYEPHLDECLENTSVYLDKRVAEKFIEMYNAALESGVTLTPASGYVSPDRQKRSFDKQVEVFVADGYTEEKAESLASFTVLPVGCSEHNYGLAVDIGHRSADFADTPAYAWLKEHAAEYGFIERYVSEKEKVTHFNAAPWHWRYVGTAAAKEMNGKGVCLEEYVGRVN
ncbi:MAG: M15 family metallopeptidase [Oscillospiraceae bacterium]|nr:M15 family metallopeptidase [Oscillospiraceae bacterium]